MWTYACAQTLGHFDLEHFRESYPFQHRYNSRARIHYRITPATMQSTRECLKIYCNETFRTLVSCMIQWVASDRRKYNFIIARYQSDWSSTIRPDKFGQCHCGLIWNRSHLRARSSLRRIKRASHIETQKCSSILTTDLETPTYKRYKLCFANLMLSLTLLVDPNICY